LARSCLSDRSCSYGIEPVPVHTVSKSVPVIRYSRITLEEPVLVHTVLSPFLSYGIPITCRLRLKTSLVNSLSGFLDLCYICTNLSPIALSSSFLDLCNTCTNQSPIALSSSSLALYMVHCHQSPIALSFRLISSFIASFISGSYLSQICPLSTFSSLGLVLSHRYSRRSSRWFSRCNLAVCHSVT
jgi:hypothetical protein